MSVLTWMRPRDHLAATRAVFTLTAVASVVTLAGTVLAPPTPGGSVSIWIMAPLLVTATAASWLLRRVRVGNDVCWTLFPMLTLALVVVLDLLSRDASVTAQIFLFFFALWGASQLNRAGAVLLTAATAAADLIVVFSLLPPQAALNDATYVVAALVTSAALLLRASEANSALLRELEHHASVDPLTGLVTRRVLDTAARATLSGAAAEDGAALVLIDIDNFKAVNDEYGHPGGDDVLVQLAALVARRCRPSDVVSRLGGDELAVLLAGSPPEAAYQRAEAIRADVASQIFVVAVNTPLRVSVSIGLAHAPTQAHDLASLYAAADSALYSAKRSGRNRVDRAVGTGG